MGNLRASIPLKVLSLTFPVTLYVCPQRGAGPCQSHPLHDGMLTGPITGMFPSGISAAEFKRPTTVSYPKGSGSTTAPSSASDTHVVCLQMAPVAMRPAEQTALTLLWQCLAGIEMGSY